MRHENHWTIKDFRQRMEVKEWRKILLAEDDYVIFKGTIVPLKAKNLGYGVVEVYKDFP